MSKADQLGAGRFGGAARPVSARRAAIGAATGVPTEGVAPPSRLPVTRISPNPENPRTTLGDLSELTNSLKEHGQKQAITVMNRDAYIKANPARASDLEPDTTHVVVDGSSRLAAAREAGLTHLNVMVDDEQGEDGDAILESALVANIHRNDLDPLDEARALQRLLSIHGSQVKLAKRLHKSQGWVSQRLALLNLSPELQAVVGEEPVELLRSVAKESHDRQEAVLQELKAERARKDAERRAPQASTVPTMPAVPPVVEPAEEAAPEAAASVPSQAVDGREVSEDPSSRQSAKVVEPSRPAPARATPVAEEVVDLSAQEAPAAQQTETVPDPRPAESLSSEADPAKAELGTARRLPYDDGAFIAMHLIQKMSDTEFDKMLDILNEHQSQRVGSKT
ncbi:ParB family chromosome partitioning protein [Streptomyces sp. TLI_55]|uniref:ParB/RepB/Spo0J family partition protein n=1 Tax=Streptomyces sp. TLI_55 TaxID=1938861 RepID=UPI000BDDB8EC|nr:ParB/RepB/Spo0J family partition protein [Streptomyces sp. TLI_55]SNX88295.1 ParB family chromosome partitioning protein [Streptomyces sp. TLI_55]